ncbi:MAG TPA: hypothetical protein VFG37_02055 [Planctomycetota bacterium]|jgi:hypothetical protein|nr:hypothetical protein [Planctomycetota bacterium]
MESKKGAFVVLGLLLVVAVVLLVVCAKRDGGDRNFDETLKSWKSGLLAKFAKSQELAVSDLSPNPFDAKGELTVSSVPLECTVKTSKRAVRSATLELAGPGTVDVSFVAKRDGRDLKGHKKLSRSSASGEKEDKARIVLSVFEGGGTLTITNLGGPASTALLRWKVE